MISFANLHDDIGNDLFDHKEQLNRLDEFHYPRFKRRHHEIFCHCLLL